MIAVHAHKLIELQEKVIEKECLENKLSSLSERNEEYKEALYYSQLKAENEGSDVLELNKSSVKNTFFKITGQIEKKRLQETQEAQAAEEAYNNLLSEYKIFEEEYKSVIKEYRGLGNCDLDYLALKTKLFSEIKNDQCVDDSMKKLVGECEVLEKELRDRKAVIENVKELITVTERILNDLEPAYHHAYSDSKSLQTSLGLSHGVSKYYHIDEIVPQIENLDKRLAELSKNTKDFPSMCIISNLKYDGLTKGTDILFEDAVSMGIERTVLQDIENLIGEIKDINKKLTETLQTFNLVYNRKKSYKWRVELDLFQAFI